MATPQKGEPSKIIGSVSKFAGTLVGTAVITGKRIIGSAKPAQKKRKAVRKAETKVPKTKKKKKVVKRKPTGSSGKGGASKKKLTQSPAKKKEVSTPRKKTTHCKTNKTAKNEVSSHSQDGLISETGAGANSPTGKQEPQLRN